MIQQSRSTDDRRVTEDDVFDDVNSSHGLDSRSVGWRLLASSHVLTPAVGHYDQVDYTMAIELPVVLPC
jgi:hypothetical protein